jgi:hypothetical protein
VFSAQLPYSSIGATSSRAPGDRADCLAADPYSVSALSPPIPQCAVSYSLAAVDFTTGAIRSFSAGQASGTNQVAVGSISSLPCTSSAMECALFLYGDVPSQLLILPPVTIAPSETLRVAVTSAAAGDKESVVACSGTIGFYDVTGAPIGTPAAFNIGQKQSVNAAELTFATAGATGLNGVASAQISLTALPLTVAYTGNAPPCVVNFSITTFDTATGATHAFVTGPSMAPATNNSPESTVGGAGRRGANRRR